MTTQFLFQLPGGLRLNLRDLADFSKANSIWIYFSPSTDVFHGQHSLEPISDLKKNLKAYHTGWILKCLHLCTMATFQGSR
jgi:hypothetical protein